MRTIILWITRHLSWRRETLEIVDIGAWTMDTLALDVIGLAVSSQLASFSTARNTVTSPVGTNASCVTRECSSRDIYNKDRQ